MRVMIDQSGKIESTAQPTVIGYANGKTGAVMLSAAIKRQLQEIFRRRGERRLFVYRTFASLIFLLLQTNPKITDMVIDTEYPGKEKLIKDILLEHIQKYKFPLPSISFQRIGNKPPAHYAAYDVFSGKKKATKVITFEEIWELAIKKDRGRKGLKKA